MFTIYDSAVLIGFVMVLCAAPFIISRKRASKATLSLIGHEPSALIAGFVTVLLSLVILKAGHTISTSYEGLIALLGWLTLIKGIWIMWFTKQAYQTVKTWCKSDNYMIASGLFGTVLGLWLMWTGLGL